MCLSWFDCKPDYIKRLSILKKNTSCYPWKRTKNCYVNSLINIVSGLYYSNKQHLGETTRTLEVRIKEHNRKEGNLAAIGEHLVQTGHKVDNERTKVIGRESKFWRRKIHESVEKRQKKPRLNRDFGYQLPTIYNSLLCTNTTSVCRQGRAPWQQ